MLNDNVSLPGGAFADDIVLTSSSHTNLQTQFNICLSFFDNFALEMALDSREKTVYTHNASTHRPLKHASLGIEVPHIKSIESYKYLGLHINLHLDWEKQTQVSNQQFQMYASYLNRKCFTASQTAEIFNLVVFPSITYRMGVVTFENKRISKWDFRVTKIMEKKLKFSCFLGFNNWSLPSYGRAEPVLPQGSPDHQLSCSIPKLCCQLP